MQLTATVFGLGLSLVAALIAGRLQSASGTDQRRLEGDLCGPICVLDVSEAYGVSASLQDILDSDLHSQSALPWSLQDIRDALSGYGVFAKCVRLEDVRSLQWPWPVVLHLDGPAHDVTTASPLAGHFVVFFPESPDPTTPVWDATAWCTLDRIASHASGAAILTAPSYRAYLAEMAPHYALAVLSVLALVGTAAFFAARLIGRKAQHAGPYLTPKVKDS